jgi:hypothetical protein
MRSTFRAAVPAVDAFHKPVEESSAEDANPVLVNGRMRSASFSNSNGSPSTNAMSARLPGSIDAADRGRPGVPPRSKVAATTAGASVKPFSAMSGSSRRLVP